MLNLPSAKSVTQCTLPLVHTLAPACLAYRSVNTWPHCSTLLLPSNSTCHFPSPNVDVHVPVLEQVCEYLAALLNAGVTPVLPASAHDSSALRQLADACHSAGLASTPSAAAPAPLADSLAAAGVTAAAPGLSAVERAVVESGAAASAGVAALTVQGARRLVTAATAVAALSVDAVGAQVSVAVW